MAFHSTVIWIDVKNLNVVDQKVLFHMHPHNVTFRKKWNKQKESEEKRNVFHVLSVSEWCPTTSLHTHRNKCVPQIELGSLAEAIRGNMISLHDADDTTPKIACHIYGATHKNHLKDIWWGKFLSWFFFLSLHIFVCNHFISHGIFFI